MKTARASLLGLMLSCLPLMAQAAFLSDTVKIGVMNDESGPYADLQGPGSVIATKMAVEDFGGKVDGHPIEVIVGDHQNKPDIGMGIARQWYDVEKVGAIVDLPQSAVALGVARVAHDKNRVALISASNLDGLTGKDCSPNQVQWGFNNCSLAKSAAQTAGQPDTKTWFLIVVDLATGHDLQSVLTGMIEEHGGNVVGAVRHPLGAADFSQYLLEAQASHAQVIALIDATSDFVGAMKQAAEFHIGPSTGQKLIGITVFEPDIRSLGLNAAQGTLLTMPFYWNLNDGTRAFSERFAKRFDGKMPTVFQAAAYSATLHYLKAVAAAGGDADGAVVVREMKKLPVEDPIFGKSTLRPDGLEIHPMYRFEVKSPGESKSPWDLYKLIATIPAEDAFRSMDEGGCPYLKEMSESK
jgi:branched-chain amino acid transport system substrate-binding protein